MKNATTEAVVAQLNFFKHTQDVSVIFPLLKFVLGRAGALPKQIIPFCAPNKGTLYPL
jgi:hypothetical protein